MLPWRQQAGPPTIPSLIWALCPVINLNCFNPSIIFSTRWWGDGCFYLRLKFHKNAKYSQITVGERSDYLLAGLVWKVCNMFMIKNNAKNGFNSVDFKNIELKFYVKLAETYLLIIFSQVCLSFFSNFIYRFSVLHRQLKHRKLHYHYFKKDKQNK